MRIFSLQPKYPANRAEASDCVEYMINHLEKLSEPADLIVLPEYSNAPGPVDTREELERIIAVSTPALMGAAASTARRLGSFVAVNMAWDSGEGLRNTTFLYGRDGKLCHKYNKLHLPYSEKVELALDHSYAFRDGSPELSGCVFEADGVRFGFLTCYDMYFSEQIEYIADFHPDVIIYPSYQRGERADILQAQIKLCAMRCNAYTVRSSYSMGISPERDNGGHTMVASPDGTIICDLEQDTGFVWVNVDHHWKYYRANGYGQPDIPNDEFVGNGRLFGGKARIL